MAAHLLDPARTVRCNAGAMDLVHLYVHTPAGLLPSASCSLQRECLRPMQTASGAGAGGDVEHTGRKAERAWQAGEHDQKSPFSKAPATPESSTTDRGPLGFVPRAACPCGPGRSTMAAAANADFYVSGQADVILRGVLGSLGTTSILVLSGVWLKHVGLIKNEGAHTLSVLSKEILIPALLLGKVAESADWQLLQSAWPIALLPLVYVPCGLLLGVIAVMIVQPGASFSKGMIAAVAFGNSTGMPLIILSVVNDALMVDGMRNNEDEHFPVDPLVYLSIYSLTYPMLQWAAGTVLLSDGWELRVPHADDVITRWGRACGCDDPLAWWRPCPPAPGPPRPGVTRAATAPPNGSSDEPGPTLMPATLLDAVADGEAGRFIAPKMVAEEVLRVDERTGRSRSVQLHFYDVRNEWSRSKSVDHASFWGHRSLLAGHSGDSERERHVAPDGGRPAGVPEEETAAQAPPAATPSIREVLSFVRYKVLPAPVRGVVIGMTIALVPFLRALIVSDDPTHPALFTWALRGISKLGDAAVPANLITLGVALAAGPDFEAVSPTSCAAVTIAKLVVMPAVAMGIVLLDSHIFPDRIPRPFHQPFYLTMFVVAATPTANNILVMCTLAGQNRAAMATCIFVQYCAAPIVLTLTISSFVAIVGTL